jgi:hypothetical protein
MPNPYAQKSDVTVIPAPIGGWNARDPLSAMPQTDAVVLENFIPGTEGVSLRPGYASHATGLGASVASLMEYSSPSTGKLFGAAGTSIYDVTSAGAVGAAAVTSTVNAVWSHAMFATSGGNYLVIANGGTSVRHYNGTIWATPTINNVTSADLNFVTVHAERLWFIEKQSLRAWYLPTNAVAGDAASFDLGPMCRLGGNLVAMASWTRDGGAGSDDVLVFLTSRGEAILYSGIDPDDADSWSRVGVFKLPEPVGRRCTFKLGADTGVITSQGVLALSSILPIASTDTAMVAVTDKIRRAFAQAYRLGSALAGWQIIEYPKRGWVIVNVPTASGFEQYLMNAASPARPWCRLTGLPAASWSLLADEIYFGGSGAVYKFDQGFLDVDEPISADALPAFSSLGNPAQKRVVLAKPLVTAADGTVPPVEIKTDYDDSPVSITQLLIPASGSPWDESPWDDSPWGPSIEPIDDWQSVQGIGQVISPRMAVTSQTPFTWHQTTIGYETGGMF